MDKALANKRENLTVLIGRLTLLPAHAALFHLRNALSIPKLLYTLRTSPCCDSAKLASYVRRSIFKSALSSIPNIDLSPPAWTQALLPAPVGRDWSPYCTQLAPPVFLASAAGTTELLYPTPPNMVPQHSRPSTHTLAEAAWRVLGGSVWLVGGGGRAHAEAEMG